MCLQELLIGNSNSFSCCSLPGFSVMSSQHVQGVTPAQTKTGLPQCVGLFKQHRRVNYGEIFFFLTFQVVKNLKN